MRVVPLVLNHFGWWSKKAESYFYLNGPEMTLGDQTGQSLKTTGEKYLLFNCKDAMQVFSCEKFQIFCRTTQVTLLTCRYFSGQGIVGSL